jgi:predicted PurR-regulated permease PerM
MAWASARTVLRRKGMAREASEPRPVAAESREGLLSNELASEAMPPALHADGADAGPSERRQLQSVSFHWLLVLACAAAALTLVPLWAPLLLASWMAMVVRPLHARLVRRVKGSGRAAAVVTVLLVVLSLAPLVVMSLSLIGAAADLVARAQSSGGVREALQTLLASESMPAGNPISPDRLELDTQQVMGFAQRLGGGALNAVTTFFGAATAATIAAFVFVYGFYTFLVDSRRCHAWIVDHSPLQRWQTLRLSAAYAETGRGLLIGVGLTALVQGGVATIGYVVIGVPQALVFGLVTVFAALIPSVGAGLVWAPLTLGLAVGGRMGEAVAVLVLGCVISVADNFIRPMLTRHARLELPTFLLFVAMLGGIAMFGTWGLLLGPLCVRLGVEALRLGRERNELGDSGRLVQTSKSI